MAIKKQKPGKPGKTAGKPLAKKIAKIVPTTRNYGIQTCNHKVKTNSIIRKKKWIPIVVEVLLSISI